MAGKADDSNADRPPSRFAGLGERVRQEASELKSRFRSQASRTWRVSNLRLEIALLERKRGRKLTELGELSYRLMQAGEVSLASMRGPFREIEDLRREIEAKEQEVKIAEDGLKGGGPPPSAQEMPPPPADVKTEAAQNPAKPRRPAVKSPAKATRKVKSS